MPTVSTSIGDRTGVAIQGGSASSEVQTHRNECVRVLLVTRESLETQVLRQRIIEATGLTVVGTVRTAMNAVACLISDQVDVIVRDQDSVPEGEFSIEEYLRPFNLAVPSLVITSWVDWDGLVRGYRDGVMGWIHRDSVLKLLPDALGALHRGGVWIDPVSLRALSMLYLR
jgi:DNA-binding NarL/FixJ family response regulator